MARVVFLGKGKLACLEALRCAADHTDVVRVVGAGLEDEARRLGLPFTDEAGALTSAPDVVISYLYPKRIREPLLSLGRIGCVNFHPAPLPDFRGLFGLNVAILEGLREWGVSAHFVDADFDTGDLIEVTRFPIHADTDTAVSLDRRAQSRLLDLFRIVVERLQWAVPLPRARQGGPSRYVSRADFERMRVVRPGDDVDRKARAFWYPPHEGAYVDGVGGTLVPKSVLARLDLHG